MRTVLTDFHNSLNGVRDVADHIDSEVGAALASSVILARHEFMQSAATVILSGFFESFLKGVAEKCIASVCLLNKLFSSLPVKMRNAHYQFGASALAQRARDDGAGRPSRIIATASDLSFRLSSVASLPYSLVWEAFAETHSNPGSQTVAQYLKRYGIQSPWAKIERKSGRSASILKLQLDSFLYLRNECAHTGTAKIIPTTNDIRQFAVVLETLADAITEILEELVAAI